MNFLKELNLWIFSLGKTLAFLIAFALSFWFIDELVLHHRDQGSQQFEHD